MSWNLLIYNPGDTPDQNEPLGGLDAVTGMFAAAFPGLEWEAPTEAVLAVDGGFRLEFTAADGLVQDVWLHGGFHQIGQLAALCSREGWRMADAQEGEDMDLDDPLGWLEARSG